MYLMALVVVEAETKDSWIWFLESLLSDLGTPLNKDGHLFLIVKR
jgi:hypothetical protein